MQHTALMTSTMIVSSGLVKSTLFLGFNFPTRPAVVKRCVTISTAQWKHHNSNVILCTCNCFDYLVSLVVAAVSGLEGDLVGSRVGGFEPRLQESGQILQHVLRKGLTGPSNLDEKAKKRTLQTSKQTKLGLLCWIEVSFWLAASEGSHVTSSS